MEITPMSMEAMIMRHSDDLEQDPHLKKLFAELQALKNELNGSKGITKRSNPSNTREGDTVPAAPKVRAKRKNTTGDSLFKCSAYVSPTRRKSGRLSGKAIDFKYMDDIDEIENNRLYANGELKGDKILKAKRSFHRRHVNSERIILTPEQITQEMLDNICYKLNDRVYDQRGTSCHQCRQKTIDTKTICRNLDCVGVRGQFCGPCAQNRYGVDVAKALLDPHWSCFVCQGICNCSFCRSRNGKRPTGILTHIAKRNGHDNVKEFLDELKLSLQEENDFNAQMEDTESVLGFSDDSNVLTVSGMEPIFQGCVSGLKAALIRETIKDFDFHFSGFTSDSIDMSMKKNQAIQNILKLAIA